MVTDQDSWKQTNIESLIYLIHPRHHLTRAKKTKVIIDFDQSNSMKIHTYSCIDDNRVFDCFC